MRIYDVECSFWLVSVSSLFKGRQMARVLNALGVHLAVYGNHDFGKCEKSVGINTSNRTALVCTFATCMSVRKIISNTKEEPK